MLQYFGNRVHHVYRACYHHRPIFGDASTLYSGHDFAFLMIDAVDSMGARGI